ncbi:MAG: cyclic nucleotide-binding domain-containing protein [Acidobacteria bacterium]|nr:cyclic nucleotide-binding domain-containing protein [Acidobacteriota bacterium]
MREFLKKTYLFSELEEAELDRVSGRLKRHEFVAGERIIQENEPADRCYMILSGTVRVTSSFSGKEDFYTILNPGDHFGEISLIDGLAPSATVMAEEPTTALSISHDDLRVFLEKDPRLAGKLLHAMLRALCHRLRETDQSLAFTRFMMRQEHP